MGSSLLIAVGNTLEAVCGAALARRFARGAAAFERSTDIFRFVLYAALPSTLISALIGVTALMLFNQERQETSKQETFTRLFLMVCWSKIRAHFMGEEMRETIKQ